MTSFLPTVAIEQDWGALARWVGEHGYELDSDRARIGQFSKGLANLNYIVHIDGSPTVLRRPPSGDLPKGANDMEREWRVLSALSTVYPLAPKPILYCADTTVLGAPFQLLEYRPGIAVGAHVPNHWSQTQTTRLRRNQVEAMVKLHNLDPVAVGLSQLGRPTGLLERQARFWVSRANDVWGGHPPYSVKELASILSRHPAPDPVRASVLHLDMKPENMLVDPDNGSPIAVIDWDMATLGDPRYDLAILMSYWIEPTDPNEVLDLERTPSLDPGAGSRDDLVRDYEEFASLELKELDWFLALARLRLSVVWRQLSLLSNEGRLIGSYYKRCGRLAIHIAEWARNEFNGKGNEWWR